MAGINRLSRGVRLRSRRDIQAVFRKGRFLALGVLRAKALATGRDGSRFLISVRKNMGSAPKRNRLKRLVREAMRLHLPSMEIPHDICFFLTSKPPNPLHYSAVEAEVLDLIKRLSSGQRTVKS